MSRRYVYDDDEESGFPRYISVTEKKQRAESRKKKLEKGGKKIKPVVITGREITKTFWGKSWCSNLERYHDYENRLSRGRSYARSGCIIDLGIQPGKISALVEGSTLYEVDIKITRLDEDLWQTVIGQCAGEILSFVDLLSGKFSDQIMKILTKEKSGIFPMPTEIKMSCSCPDYATVCKHVAAVLYGVGHRLDSEPELFFTLRSVQSKDLISSASAAMINEVASTGDSLEASQLEDLFGIEIADAEPPVVQKKKKKRSKDV